MEDDGEGGNGDDADVAEAAYDGEDDVHAEAETSRSKKKKKKKKSKKKKTTKPSKEEESDFLNEKEMEEVFEGDYESEEPVDENGNDSSSDYEEAPKSKKKKRGKSSKKKPAQPTADDDSDSDDSIDPPPTKPKKKQRSSRSKPSKKGKMAQHLRDRHAKARLRQLEEARIRKEELGHLANDDAGGDDKSAAPKEDAAEGEEGEGAARFSKEDRERALLIAARFDTNREELRAKRAEDRVGLIERLRKKRLESMAMDEAGAGAEEGEAKEGDAKEDGPKLTATNDAATEVPTIGTPALAGAMVDLESDEDSSDGDEESDDDLEIIAAPTAAKENMQQPAAPSVAKDSAKTVSSNSKAAKKTSAIDLLFQTGGKATAQRPLKTARRSTADSRVAMRNALNAKRVQTSNRWLAKELGYDNVEEHIHECKETEARKKAQALKLETAAREAAKERQTLIEEGIGEDELSEVEEDAAAPPNGNDDEEDEEMAMAREMGQLEPTDDADVDEENRDENEANNLDKNGNEKDEQVDEMIERDINVRPEAEESKEESISDVKKSFDGSGGNPNTSDGKPGDDNFTPDALSSPGKTSTGSVVTPLQGTAEAVPISENPEEGASVSNQDDLNEVADSTEENSKQDGSSVSPEKSGANDSNSLGQTTQNDEADTNPSNEASSQSKETTEPSPAKSKKPKNSAWQAMLRKEKEALAKQKKLQKKGGALVDGEAEEEEEEEGIVGLEDFGFAVQPKKGDDDDDDADADVDQDDLDHVVDDLSDGEGDEEAGNKARQLLQNAEEKQRHKEIMRRVREGFDGRRGGIASHGARGTLRFDQLVAADNREDAKRLGLLNDDEIDSDDENEGGEKKPKGSDEVEDENALLDKFMKERHMQVPEEEQVEENFTDDEESDDEATGADQGNGDEDEEDREQDRLAKHFAKRARRNRVLEEFEGDSQFTRSRLIDEDESTQQDLKTMKTSLCRKRSSMSILGSNLGSNLDSKENNCSSKKPKSSDGSAPKPTSSFLAHEGSLSVALMASRRTAGRKRKTTFLSKSSSFSKSHSASSSSSKTVSLSVAGLASFVGGESQSTNSQFLDASSNSFLGTSKSRRGHLKTAATKKPSRGGGSLWSKVCSKNFRAN